MMARFNGSRWRARARGPFSLLCHGVPAIRGLAAPPSTRPSHRPESDRPGARRFIFLMLALRQAQAPSQLSHPDPAPGAYDPVRPGNCLPRHHVRAETVRVPGHQPVLSKLLRVTAGPRGGGSSSSRATECAWQQLCSRGLRMSRTMPSVAESGSARGPVSLKLARRHQTCFAGSGQT